MRDEKKMTFAELRGETMNHEIIKRRMNEPVYTESGEVEGLGSILYRKHLVTNVYEQFRCNRKHKLITLELHDFDFCPFCGEAVNEQFR